MIAFMNKLKEGLFNSFEINDYLAPSLRIFKQRKAIREALVESRITGKVVGVYAHVLGEGMFLTCVEEITTRGKDDVVSLKPYDMNGVLLVRNELCLSEIKSVCPFESFYVNPLSLTKNFNA
jgi:hypothetical protein